MAKLSTVQHDTDCVRVVFHGNPAKPEPHLGVIQFPGGLVEVSRCTDGSYWAHVRVGASSNIRRGRLDYCDRHIAVSDLPDANKITKIAINITN